ncbi:Bypass of stop codon protein 6 [Colletotrichum tropicale]|nr:Bypass of stop codon protein 6 [Colletotrichum tropicale]
MTSKPHRPTSSRTGETEPLLEPATQAHLAEDGLLGSDRGSQTSTDELPAESATLRIAAAAWSFAVVGLFTSTTGAVIPHLEESYQLTDIQVSALFLVGPIGYVIASYLNDSVHAKFGQRGIAVIGPLCHLLYAAVAAVRPPFPVFLMAAAIESCILCWAFRNENAERYHKSKLYQEIASDPASKGAIFKYKATWVYAGYLLIYVGAECTISGWIVAFMLRVRHASTYASSICSSAFWAGMAAGRLMLGVVTDKLGVKRAVVVYLIFAPVFTLLFIFVRVLWFSVVVMALLGFVMGPLFPSAIVQLVNLLPKELHVAAVSFVASLGQVGGALLPYMLGAITQVAGLETFQYMLLVQFGILFIIWIPSFGLSSGQ